VSRVVAIAKSLDGRETLWRYGLPEKVLAAHEPPITFKRFRPQPVYFSFFQWPFSQVMPDHS